MIEHNKRGFDSLRINLVKKDLGRPNPLVSRAAILSIVYILLALFMLAAPTVSSARVDIGISVNFAPPALPIYVQPLCPGPDYIWTPGYWAWDPDTGYYWVPGTWVLAPFTGALWTPGYWGWSDGVYVWFPGYWGLTVGFYGGINYGFGYIGYGYEGGYWDHGSFYYNRSVNNVTNITNVYTKAVSPVTASHISYNGGRGGTTARPTASQLAAVRQRHSPPTEVQLRNERAARSDPGQRAAVNHGRPAVAATPKAGMLSGSAVVRASRAGAPYKAMSSGQTIGSGSHAQPSHPAVGVEKGPRVTATKHAAPPAPLERHVAPRTESARPAYRPNEAHQPAPPAHLERHAAPRNESARPAYRPNEARQPAPPAHLERHAAPRNESARPANRPNEARHNTGAFKCC